MFDIRTALPDDVEEIMAVRAAVWPEQRNLPDYILACVRNTEHVVWIAESERSIVGFVDSFITTAQDGTRRWEIDLLAVHPDHQGRGLGTALVQAAYESGRERRADMARALVNVENIGSQQAFARCGFAPQRETCRLWVALPLDEQVAESVAAGLHLVQVQTFSYRGLWLEGVLTAATLHNGITECSRRKLDIAGAVIPLHQQEAFGAAEQLGFKAVGEYQWWTR